jgi:hypothetical protein
VQGGAGVVQGVAGAAVVLEEQGDVVAGLPGAVDVAAGFPESDRLLVVVQAAAGVPGLAVDVAELVVVMARFSASSAGNRSRACW